MPKACSLFSGIGGIDLGFKQGGFDIVWANEFAAHNESAKARGKNFVFISNLR